jgi:hypothetical protein
MSARHPHPLVSKSDVATLNTQYAPWRIEKAWQNVNPAMGAGSRKKFFTQASNAETGEVLYRCEGWTQAARGQALNAILERIERDGIREDAATARELLDTAALDAVETRRVADGLGIELAQDADTLARGDALVRDAAESIGVELGSPAARPITLAARRTAASAPQDAPRRHGRKARPDATGTRRLFAVLDRKAKRPLARPSR